MADINTVSRPPSEVAAFEINVAGFGVLRTWHGTMDATNPFQLLKKYANADTPGESDSEQQPHHERAPSAGKTLPPLPAEDSNAMRHQSGVRTTLPSLREKSTKLKYLVEKKAIETREKRQGPTCYGRY